ncbi:Myb-like DNA-binding domain containing protein [Trichomonas vaginalis G3]|uniref:Myb-like DNA-binding domain containing protein n=1 Tax=Trichomonas vaginalis (strain ATCC PRA-98 / G3) TaxID=412133 RepID=A2FD09_TRIV3|nr:RNA polymerase II transcription regulator recruiting protein [Trichomonas vaginalis G3]EAX97202.1 Myb-like DNA-binding domain containing protein [Trichomonas vaginalis G3]KAI5536191.1 RNA polymerase II transcription regulator recruiting protein [Trichomonas vaginalis G3]|eukprot:XP_001310132.1 Myb-like DNA-binding domain containing protein [Trichomonas vaginalis G3]
MMKNRNARQCKERYTKYLSPDINRNPWTPEEDELLKEKLCQLGPKWVKISKLFDRRTDAALKNRWCILKKSLIISNDSSSSESEKEAPKPIEKDDKNDILPSIESWFNDFENLDIPIEIFEQA